MAIVRVKRYTPDHPSMARFLMSGRVQRVAMAAGRDIAEAAGALAARDADSGKYAAAYAVRGSTHSGKGLEGGPRRTAEVFNPNKYAAYLELRGFTRDGRKRKGRHYLARAGMQWHVPKGAVRVIGR